MFIWPANTAVWLCGSVTIKGLALLAPLGQLRRVRAAQLGISDAVILQHLPQVVKVDVE